MPHTPENAAPLGSEFFCGCANASRPSGKQRTISLRISPFHQKKELRGAAAEVLLLATELEIRSSACARRKKKGGTRNEFGLFRRKTEEEYNRRSARRAQGRRAARAPRALREAWLRPPKVKLR